MWCERRRTAGVVFRRILLPPVCESRRSYRLETPRRRLVGVHSFSLVCRLVRRRRRRRCRRRWVMRVVVHHYFFRHIVVFSSSFACPSVREQPRLFGLLSSGSLDREREREPRVVGALRSAIGWILLPLNYADDPSQGRSYRVTSLPLSRRVFIPPLFSCVFAANERTKATVVVVERAR